jgi:DNA-binding NarL/FixJ family response regulator
MSKGERKATVVLVIDDHPLIRSALREVLGEAVGRVELLEADDPVQGLERLRQRPDTDLVFLDLSYSGHNGLVYVQEFRELAPPVPLIVFTMQDDAGVLRRALCGGAAAIVPKTHSAQLVRKAIELVMGGGVYVPPDLVRQLALGAVGDTATAPSAAVMSPQQWRIAKLLAQGLPNKEIGRKLGLAPSTVKNQLTAVFGRLGVSNRTQAAMAAGALLGEHRLALHESRRQSGT